MVAVTKVSCDERHKSLRWYFKCFLSVAVVVAGAIGGISVSGQRAATEAASRIDSLENATERTLDSLQEDVREIRRILLRIEKNGGK